MATPVIMPRQGQSVESCIITKWNKHVGDKVAVGDVLFSYETDKSSFDEEAKTEGELLAVFFDEGDDVECLLNVCVIGNHGESTEEFNPRNEKPSEPEKAEVKAEEPKVAPAPEAVATVNIGDRLRISPRARALAEKQNADLRYAVATGQRKNNRKGHP